MIERTIIENEAGQRFDKYLAKYLNQAPKSFFYKMLRKKNITLNGKKATGSEKLVTGDVVRLFLSDETIQNFRETKAVVKTKASLDIIYEDEQILLVNKPAGMLSQKAKISDISLTEHILSYLLEKHTVTEESLQTFRPSVCNRLDRNTSGIVIAGKTLAGLQEMSRLLKERTMHKYYLCMVSGQIRQACEIQGYLLKDEKKNKVSILTKPAKDAKEIHTRYQPLATNGTETLLQVELLTGRSHQIRAHLASIGHPILGDSKYGSTAKASEGQYLHSYCLVMPVFAEGPFAGLSGRRFYAPVPAGFEKTAKKKGLGKWQHGIPEVSEDPSWKN